MDWRNFKSSTPAFQVPGPLVWQLTDLLGQASDLMRVLSFYKENIFNKSTGILISTSTGTDTDKDDQRTTAEILMNIMNFFVFVKVVLEFLAIVFVLVQMQLPGTIIKTDDSDLLIQFFL